MVSTPACQPGATSTRRSVTGAANTPATRTGTGSARCTSTRSRVSGRCCALGSARIGASRKRSCRTTSASSSSYTTRAAGAKLSSAPSSRALSPDVPVTTPEPDKSLEDYMDLGTIEASDVAREITGSPTVNAMGYCIGGTLLTLTLATLAAKGDNRFNAASFMVSMQDFSRVGDTAVFMDEPAIDLIEQQMMERGYLDSREMSNMFNLLRSNDLIWSNVVNNYLLGNK